ncbi:MAG TPA: AMP-binding protein, partial [Myxococcota bacterium]|nr:AMP-binding protein [Myxococcota bacterium]
MQYPSGKSGVPEPGGLMIEAATLWHLIEARAQATPERRMAVDQAGRELDFAGYRDAALRAARGLHALGVGPESVVAWMLPTRLETLILVGALARLDAIQIP